MMISAILCSLGVLFSLVPPLAKTTVDGFAVPQPGHAFVFPKDHGAHADFRIEWWYVTGHLFTKDQKRYGFQATFFRRAGVAKDPAERRSFASSPLYLAHMALLNAESGEFLHQERLNRSGWDAAAAADTLDLRNGNWSLRFAKEAAVADTMELRGSIRGDASFTLTLTPQKPLVVFGEDGVSRKGESATAASYYLTWPRLAVSGSLQTGTERREVTGSAWMDHEISSGQLSPGQAGWDWACLQLDDGRDLMAYRMRLADGATDAFSTLAWIDKEGHVKHIAPGPFRWETLDTWISPKTKAVYPVEVKITAPDPVTGKEVSFQLEPLAREQELSGALGGVTYWEGACRIRDAAGRECGRAFLELTGYAGDLGARLR
jgi:predicted secreted hydrolase